MAENQAVPGRTANQSDLTARLEQRAKETAVDVAKDKAPSAVKDPIWQLLEANKSGIMRALPRTGMSHERLARIAATTIKSNPELLSCNSRSLIAAIMLSAQLGLEPGGPLGHAYIIPYKGQAQFQIGYRGYLELMWRAGTISSLAVHEVCDGDDFQFEYGLDEKLIHRPALKGQRGQAYAYYLVAHYKSGGHFIFVMGRDDIERIRRFSSAPNSPAWRDHYDAMACKTVAKQSARWMPMSVEIQRALDQDETVRIDTDEDMTDAPTLDVEYSVTDAEADSGAPGHGR